jgi:hypothetical protein
MSAGVPPIRRCSVMALMREKLFINIMRAPSALAVTVPHRRCCARMR